MSEHLKHKVLVIPAWFDHEDPSKGLFIDEFCSIMHRSGTEITLLYLHFINVTNIFQLFSGFKGLQKNYNVLPIRLINLKSKFFFFLSSTQIRNIYRNIILKRLKAHSPDLIHLQSLCNNLTPFIGAELAHSKKIDYVITEHYSSYKEAKGKIFAPFLTEKEVIAIAAKARYRTAVSVHATQLMQSYFNTTFNAVPNFIHDLFFSKQANVEKKKKFTFIIIAPLEVHKGIHELLKAFEKLKETQKDVQLTVVGKGSLEGLINEKLNMFKDDLKHYKWQDRNNIIDRMDESHCLISASDYETFGLTIVEAQLRGLPVISTRSGGPEELITASQGILIDKENRSENLLKAMSKMLAEHESYNKESIIRSAKEKYSPEMIAKEYHKIYSACKKES